MFQTFNCAELYIASQAVLVLVASCTSSKVQDRSLTGTVVDSGDGVTDVIPIAEGYVIRPSIQSIPIARRDITDALHSIRISVDVFSMTSAIVSMLVFENRKRNQVEFGQSRGSVLSQTPEFRSYFHTKAECAGT
ncbi:hypothetical protein B9Z19DRAFT_1126133 [Tuber borchii]|uniref:Uncharacterized protein n=1 Tax=Tuber borchii TaxID=42251 RepID=A0A2T6ZTE5_TUBBO|nr:hypothetical protein B9Z19DRAFT_1126133 [Tuber borchii]